MADFLKNPLAGLFVLAAAAGGPYLWYETEVGQQSQSALSSATQDWGAGILNESADSSASSINGATTGPGMLAGAQRYVSADPFNPQNRTVEQLPIMSLADVLRFDISPDFVIARYPRVSTLLSETQLDGMRAPLITGTTPSDLAGTITYYFDRFKQLKRVTVHAKVGDPTRFVAELQRYYQMSQEPSLGGSLYAIKWNGSPASLLHITPAPIVYNDSLYGRFNLFLELNQAGMEYGLSQEAKQLVENGRQSQRW